MALLPSTPASLLAFALIVGGTAWLSLRRDVPKAYALAVVNMGVFGIDIFFTAGRPLAIDLGFIAAPFVAGEAWWTPLSSMFVHAGLLHIFGNLFILLTAGPSLEERIGAKRFLLIYFVSGFAAVAAHTGLAYTTNLVDINSIAVGASGAIFGVLTAFAVRFPREQLPIIFFVFVRWMPSFVVLLIHLAFNLVYLLSDTFGRAGGIAWWGHFAGFLVGLAWAYRLPQHDPTGVPTGSAGLPDADKLAPLATTYELKEILQRIRQFTPTARTKHDDTFAQAWVDKFLAKATCPTCGQNFHREGMNARCGSGETTIDIGHD